MIDAAERLIAERGLAAVTLQDVQNAAGQSNRSAAKYHFGSRDGLLDELQAQSALLFRHIQRPEFQVRLRWQPNTVAIWDNRTCQHYAASDYFPARRVMDRMSIVGDRPVGISA
ncbi:MAG: taurine dioxygenase [Nocardia sp.]|nr:TauD/TfdA family dioxygenase [Nocardia sp.]MCU1639860.1 taurine dioxygenase [Nocardia sp.]